MFEDAAKVLNWDVCGNKCDKCYNSFERYPLNDYKGPHVKTVCSRKNIL
jgi:hypothetical protein